MRGSPWVWLPDGTRLELGIVGFGPLDYATGEDAEGVVIRPHYPPLGYLDIRYAGAKGRGTLWKYTLAGRFLGVGARSIDDGHAVIGPMPAGTYSVNVAGLGFRTHSIGPIAVGAGRTTVPWRGPTR